MNVEDWSRYKALAEKRNANSAEEIALCGPLSGKHFQILLQRASSSAQTTTDT